MKLPILAGAAVLALGLSSASAFAATTHHHHHHVAMVKKPVPVTACVALERQFAAAAKSHRKAALFAEAVKLNARGTKLCADHHPIRGEWDLRWSLRDIGVVPKA